MNIKTILFPTDFSESSKAALSFASSLASENDALLDIVHVGNESDAYLAGYGGFGPVLDLAERVAEENKKSLSQVKPTLANVKYAHHYLHGVADTEILAFVEREGVDLIVIGSHGRTGLSRLLLGSVAEAVVRRAGCPVLTVKNPNGEASESEVDQEKSESDQQGEKASHPVRRSKHSLH